MRRWPEIVALALFGSQEQMRRVAYERPDVVRRLVWVLNAGSVICLCAALILAWILWESVVGVWLVLFVASVLLLKE